MSASFLNMQCIHVIIYDVKKIKLGKGKREGLETDAGYSFYIEGWVKPHV